MNYGSKDILGLAGVAVIAALIAMVFLSYTGLIMTVGVVEFGIWLNCGASTVNPIEVFPALTMVNVLVVSLPPKLTL